MGQWKDDEFESSNIDQHSIFSLFQKYFLIIIFISFSTFILNVLILQTIFPNWKHTMRLLTKSTTKSNIWSRGRKVVGKLPDKQECVAGCVENMSLLLSYLFNIKYCYVTGAWCRGGRHCFHCLLPALQAVYSKTDAKAADRINNPPWFPVHSWPRLHAHQVVELDLLTLTHPEALRSDDNHI